MRRRAVFFALLIISLAMPGVTALPNLARAAAEHILITEIQIAGTQANDEFIELYNPTDTSIDVSTWSIQYKGGAGSTFSRKNFGSGVCIPPHSWFLFAHSNYSGAALPNVSHSTFTLSGTGGSVFLVRSQTTLTTGSESAIIDRVGYGTGNLLPESTAAPAPPANQSIHRKYSNETYQDTDDNSQDFELSTTPSPQSSSETEITCSESGSQDESDDTPPTAQNSGAGGISLDPNRPPQPGEVVINEFVSDPADGSEEWVELYNRTSRYFDLTGFTIEEGGGSSTQLTGGIGADISSRFALITYVKGSLNNDGDILILKHQGTEIDRVAYGNWDDGTKSDNAPAAKDPQATGRLLDGGDSNNDSLDFIITEPTPGLPNRMSTESTTEEAATPETSSPIFINELFPNPLVNDAEGEFIELANLSSSAVEIGGWILSDGLTSYSFPMPTTAPAEGFLLLRRAQTGIVLDNEGTETLTLTPLSGKAVKTSYKESVEPGMSWSRRTDGSYGWTDKPTPGQKNDIPRANTAPRAYIDAPGGALAGTAVSFDGSDSIDPDGDPITYEWSFGDGSTSSAATASHTYDSAGVYTVEFTASDSFGARAKKEHIISVTDGSVLGEKSTSADFILSEFIPNPIGSDTAEWVEIFNPGNTPGSTSGWHLLINGKLYELPALDIPSGEYAVIERSDAKFTLVNTGGSVALLAPDNDERVRVEYGQAKEGESYARDGSAWRWTSDITPGEENSFSNTASVSGGSEYESVALSEVRALDHGTKVMVEGTVTSPRGELGANIMFLAGSGLQISGSGTGWPKLMPGDRVRLSGSISKSSSGTKLIVRSGKYVQLLGKNEITAPERLPLADIDEDKEGWLVTAAGLVTARTATTFTMSEDGETMKVYLKNRTLDWQTVAVGQRVEVTGFVAMSSNVPVLWARNPSDITISEAPEPMVSGETIDLSRPSTQNTNWQGYLLLGLILTGLVLSYLWERLNWPSLRQIWNKLRRRAA